jgi:hypothetical protein
LFTISPPPPAAIHRGVNRPLAILGLMADFLVVLGIVAFVAAMLGLIWGLERI